MPVHPSVLHFGNSRIAFAVRCFASCHGAGRLGMGRLDSEGANTPGHSAMLTPRRRGREEVIRALLLDNLRRLLEPALVCSGDFALESQHLGL